MSAADEKDKIVKGGSQDISRGTVTLEVSPLEVELVTVARKLANFR